MKMAVTSGYRGMILMQFAEENPELQTQIGCMSGVFQIFDRHRLLTGKRLNGHRNKGLPSDSSSLGSDHSACSPRIFSEKKLSKSFSMESSKTSFSSSSFSSFSSSDCIKSTQQQPSSVEQSFYAERSIQNPPKLMNYKSDGKPIPQINPANPPIQSGSQSTDLRDVVKDSIHKNSQALPVKNLINEETKHYLSEQRESPKPMRLSKLKDVSYGTRIEGKLRIPVYLNESLRVLDKLKKAPQYFLEANEAPRKSYESKDTSYHPVSKGSARFSFDDRESRSFLYSQENSMSYSKLRERPRLSLDSREGSPRRCNLDSKRSLSLQNLDKSIINRRTSMDADHQQEMGRFNRPSSVVVKLMGLETMPNLKKDEVDLADTYAIKNFCDSNRQKNNSIISNTSTTTQDSSGNRLLCISKSSIKEPVTPQRDKIHVPHSMMSGYREDHMKRQPGFVYGEMQQRLQELEFQKSNKDLRALKQVMDSMHTKGHLESKKDGPPSRASVSNTAPGNSQNLRIVDAGLLKKKGIVDAGNRQITLPVPTLSEASKTPRDLESPIVIMKPVKTVNRSGFCAPSVMHSEHLTTLRRPKMSDPKDKRSSSISIGMGKDRSPKYSFRELFCQPHPSADIKCKKEENDLPKTLSRISQVSGSSVKSSNSLSPRLQKKKLETEKPSHLPIPSSETKKLQRQSANRSSESVSPRIRLRQKPAHAQQNDSELGDISSEARSLSHQGDEIFLGSDSYSSLTSQVDCSAVLNLPFSQRDCSSPSGRSADSASSKHMRYSCGSNEVVSAMALATVPAQQPSPICVLDASVYQDDFPLSPVKRYSNELRGTDDEIRIRTSDSCCSSSGLPDISSHKSKSRFNHKTLKSIDSLVQKLRQLSSNDDEAPDTNHISSLCKTQCPDHRYISEILLASGILMKDLTSGPSGVMPIQLSPSGHPINPELFLVLEQTKFSWVIKPECINKSIYQLKSDPEKLHHKLAFDLVNELLIQKQKLNSCLHLLFQDTTAMKFLSGQHLLKELCADLEQLKAQSSGAGNHDDATNSMWSKDKLHQLPAIVLDIERSIFKDLIEDLIDEVLDAEAASGLQAKTNRRRRQLFAK